MTRDQQIKEGLAKIGEALDLIEHFISTAEPDSGPAMSVKGFQIAVGAATREAQDGWSQIARARR